MKKLFFLMALSAGFGAVSSCNTYIGMGRDIQRLGEGIQNTGYGTGWSGNKPSRYEQPAQPAEKKP